MAEKLNAGEYTRRDYFFVDPFEIEVKEDLRGREFPPTDEQIIEMAMSIYDNTQLQPIGCRKLPDKRLQSVAGFTRIAAIRLIREGFTGTDGEFRQDPDFKVKLVLSTINDEQALVNNIVENAHRNETSDIDDAFNQNKLRERYGRTDTDIAKVYQYKNPNKVARLKRLLELSRPEQMLVHSGKLPTSAALDLLDLPPDERATIIENLQKDDGTIVGSEVTDVVRDHILRDDGKGTKDADGDVVVEDRKHKPRSMANLRKAFAAIADAEDTDPAIKSFARSIRKFMDGKVSDGAMRNALIRLLRAEETEWEYEEAA